MQKSLCSDDGQKATISALDKGFNEPEHSDLVVKCQGVSFYCHKVVLCNRNQFFEAACKHDMKEKTTNEIEIKEEQSSTVELALRFLYTGRLDLSAHPNLKSQLKETVYEAARLYGLAEKFHILDLKQIVLIELLWECVGWLDLEDFPELIRIAYSSTPEWDRGLRDLLIFEVGSRNRTLDTKFKDVLLDLPESAADFTVQNMEASHAGEADWEILVCSQCEREFHHWQTINYEKICNFCGHLFEEQTDTDDE